MTAGPWLVTGASGFLGRHLHQEIENTAAQRPTLALVRSEAAWREMDWTQGLSRTEVVVGSVTEPTPWAGNPKLTGLAGIFHLAALVRHCRRDADEVYRTNVAGTVAMVRLAARHRCRMIFVSTSGTVACFRDPAGTADEESGFCEATVGRWPYYHSKIRAEREARRLARELEVDLVIVRPPVLLGPGDHRFRSTNYVSRLLLDRLPFLLRGGMHYADVRDAAGALVRAMQLATARPVYHLPGTSQTIEEFFAGAASAAGRPAPRRVLPYGVAHLLAQVTQPFRLLPDPVIVEMARHYWGMRSRYAEPDLGYRSRPGRETVADTVAWLTANHPELRP